MLFRFFSVACFIIVCSISGYSQEKTTKLDSVIFESDSLDIYQPNNESYIFILKDTLDFVNLKKQLISYVFVLSKLNAERLDSINYILFYDIFNNYLGVYIVRNNVFKYYNSKKEKITKSKIKREAKKAIRVIFTQ